MSESLQETLNKIINYRRQDMQQNAQVSEPFSLTTDETHQLMVSRLVKPGEDILATLTPEKVDLWHMSTGVVGEAGELSEAVKKHVAYGKKIDFDNVMEELGDLEFYMQGIRQNMNITREQTLIANIQKLSVRYHAGYSDKAAQERADKAVTPSVSV